MVKGKVVVVTGGASGLGRVLVEDFISKGAKVAFTYKSSTENAKALMDKYPGKVMGIQADAIDYHKALEVIEQTCEVFGTIDVLVNNASHAKDASILNQTYENWDYTIKSVLYPSFNYTKAVADIFKEKKSGKIVTIGSINGLRGREGSLAYSTAKSALIGFTKTIAKELGQYEVNCNLIAPGFINTDGQADTSDLIKKLVLDECYIRKLTDPQAISNLVIFLSSESADSITGEVYKIDCGQYM